MGCFDRISDGKLKEFAAFKICDALGLDFGGSAAEKADLVPRVAKATATIQESTLSPLQDTK